LKEFQRVHKERYFVSRFGARERNKDRFLALPLDSTPRGVEGKEAARPKGEGTKQSLFPLFTQFRRRKKESVRHLSSYFTDRSLAYFPCLLGSGEEREGKVKGSRAFFRL